MPLYALSGVARSGATRSNWHSTISFISVDGALVGGAFDDIEAHVVDGSLSIDDVIDDTPNTARMDTKGFIPVEGQEVIITLGSINNLQREFAGQILSAQMKAVGYIDNYTHELSLIDFTWGLNKRVVTAQFSSTTVLEIAQSLIATYAAGYTVRVNDDIGAETIDLITFTDQDLTSALTQLVKRVGGNWLCDYHKVVALFFEDTSATNPTLINRVSDIREFTVTRDLSQVITRVRSEGGGTNALADVAAGDTIIPVQNAIWYPDPSIITTGRFTVTLGGVNCGPQRITYSSVDQGGGGGLVGPGASPSGVPALALAGGSGIESGAHNYAATFVTAAGESLPSPIATITVGPISAPGAAPVAGDPIIGTGPDPGSHDYAVTFVTATGETTASPSVTKATSLTPAPTTAPTPGAPTSGGSVDVGVHDYAATFVTSIGETTPSPISGQVTTSTVAAHPVADPSSAPSVSTSSTGGGSDTFVAGDTYYFSYAYENGYGSTVISPATAYVPVSYGPGVWKASIVVPCSTDPAVTTIRLYRTQSGGGTAYGSGHYDTYTAANNSAGGTVTFLNSDPDAFLSSAQPSSNTATVPSTSYKTVPLTSIPIGDANVTSRKLYRRSGGAGLKLLATIADNVTTTYTDTTANASLGAAPPSVSTAYLQRIQLSGIPLGGSLVTARKVYRTAAGGTQLKLVTTLADNTTTTLSDTVTDAGLGANIPTVNTAAANRVAVSAIPIGAASVTSRKVYRTAAGGTQLKLLATIADNTTTTYADSTADASLGANVPVSDGSGLTQPSGQVLAGSTSLPVAGTGGFSSAGGWAVIGNGAQVVRYTGISGSSLTGIPASGAGSIVASISYNSTVTAAPCLRGIPASGAGAVLYSIKKGDPVNLFVVVDDVTAQADLATLIGGDGIQEDAISDNRLSSTEATARAEARLELLREVIVTIHYKSNDINTRSGRTVTVNLGAPWNMTAQEFMIQRVTESDFYPAMPPTFSVEASSVRFSFEDLLRNMRKAA